MEIATETHHRVAVTPAIAPNVRTLAIVLLLVACSAWLYGRRLEYAPPHVEIDEVLIAIDAHSISRTGRDLRGELLPLYSQTAEHSWYQPFVIYLTALVLRVAPLSEWVVRLPTVCIAILNIALMYFVARRLFGSDLFGAVAAFMLALTPAHFIHTRYGMDYIYPVPFILTWLLCLVEYNERPQPWLLVAGVTALGIGFYSYISSIVMMPLYAVLTCLMLARQHAPRRSYWLVAASFLPWLAPFLVWLARHPAAYAATIEKYGVYDASQLNAVQGLRSFLSFTSVSQRLSQYWNFFNPSFLFFGGGTKVMFSTGLAGVFLLPFAVFLIIGIYRAVKRLTPVGLVLVAGFAVAPLPALLVAEENAIFRALSLLPFAVLLATMGVEYLWSASIDKPVRAIYRPLAIAALAVGVAYGSWTLVTQAHLTRSSVPLVALGAAALLAGKADRVTQWKIVAVGLLALMPVQFWSFRRDYFSDYRVRSAVWLGGNIRGALEELIDRDRREHAPQIYFSPLRAGSGQLDGRNQYMDAYWKFYVIKHGRQDLLARTMPFDPDKVRTSPPGSLVLANLEDPVTGALVKTGELKPVATISELDRSKFFVVLQR
jgi:4-amino-4-deoxy-L-arabinose transferase-like glycosyltransferase